MCLTYSYVIFSVGSSHPQDYDGPFMDTIQNHTPVPTYVLITCGTMVDVDMVIVRHTAHC